MLAARTKVVPTGDTTPITLPPIEWKDVSSSLSSFLTDVVSKLTAQAAEFDPEVAPYAGYALEAQGKQLRSILVGFSGKAFGPLQESHVTVAVIIEMVHLATLVHDDIMDEAKVRRGRPTLSSQWGNEISILVGDCLFALALKLAASFTTPEICRAVAAATNRVCAGEILQTRKRRDFGIRTDECLKILEMKTAELFALSCELGARSSQAAEGDRDNLRDFGIAWGTAYQIYDDCVDLFGSEKSALKSLGTDLSKGKLTLPVLFTWEKANDFEREQLKLMVENWSEENLAPLHALLEKYQALDQSLAVIDEYLLKAKTRIVHFPDSEGKQGLLRLADYLWQQSRLLRG